MISMRISFTTTCRCTSSATMHPSLTAAPRMHDAVTPSAVSKTANVNRLSSGRTRVIIGMIQAPPNARYLTQSLFTEILRMLLP